VYMSLPLISETSNGPVVDVHGNMGSEPQPPLPGAPKPHNPFKDDITLLVEQSVVPNLSIGMGLGATWVQIVCQDLTGENPGPAEEEKRNKAHKQPVGKYWYVDELVKVYPSYHTA